MPPSFLSSLNDDEALSKEVTSLSRDLNKFHIDNNFDEPIKGLSNDHCMYTSEKNFVHSDKIYSNFVGNYVILNQVGSGAFGEVFLAQHKLLTCKVAIKMLDKHKIEGKSKIKVKREIKILQCIDHPNIVRLYQVMETDDYVYLVMENCSGGELFNHITNGKASEAEARKLIRPIISAMQYCHQNNITHRDLKAENILLDDSMNIKIVDFGFSNIFSRGGRLDTFCGSPPYAAPELFRGKQYEGPGVDVWSLGILMYALVAGQFPFEAPTVNELKEKILKCRYRVPYFMSSDMEQLIKRMLCVNMTKRATIDEVAAHRWTNNGYELPPLEQDLKDKRLQSTQLKSEIELDHNILYIMKRFGYDINDVVDSIRNDLFDENMGCYQLLRDIKEKRLAINDGSEARKTNDTSETDYRILEKWSKSNAAAAQNEMFGGKKNVEDKNPGKRRDSFLSRLFSRRKSVSKNEPVNNFVEKVDQICNNDDTSSTINGSSDSEQADVARNLTNLTTNLTNTKMYDSDNDFVNRNSRNPLINTADTPSSNNVADVKGGKKKKSHYNPEQLEPFQLVKDLKNNKFTLKNLRSSEHNNRIDADSLRPTGRNNETSKNFDESHELRKQRAYTTADKSMLRSYKDQKKMDTTVVPLREKQPNINNISNRNSAIERGSKNENSEVRDRARTVATERPKSEYNRSVENRIKREGQDIYNTEKRRFSKLWALFPRLNFRKSDTIDVNDEHTSSGANTAAGSSDRARGKSKSSNNNNTNSPATSNEHTLVYKGQTLPRKLFFTWSIKTSSTKPPMDIQSRLVQVLLNADCDLIVKRPFLLVCRKTIAPFAGYSDGEVVWEMEICRLNKANTYGIHYKRIKGPSLQYKNIVVQILDQLDI